MKNSPKPKHLSFFYIISKLGLNKTIFDKFYGVLINDNLRAKFCLSRLKQIKISSRVIKSNLIKNTISHNLTAFEHFFTDFSMQRSKRLIFSVLADEKINFDSKFLIIGPRTENEIIFLQALGFRNIQAIDLISYSNLVKPGDMHSIPFPNEKFDAVVCGWTLSYSTKPQKALKEMLKKCKKGGLLAIGIEHAKITRKNDKIRQQDIRLIDSNVSKSRVNSVSDITRLLPKGCIKSLNYQYDAELKNMRKNDIFKKTGLHSSQVMITIKKK